MAIIRYDVALLFCYCKFYNVNEAATECAAFSSYQCHIAIRLFVNYDCPSSQLWRNYFFMGQHPVLFIYVDSCY